LNPGEFLCLRGTNGSGKTTFLRTLAGLVPPTHGNIQWGTPQGPNLSPAPVFYVGHQVPLRHENRVSEELLFLALLHQTPLEKLSETLKAWQVEHLWERPANTLSEGEKRRIFYALMEATKKPVWILDEPFNALDKAGQKQLVATLQEHLKHQGMVILACHHDLSALLKTPYYELTLDALPAQNASQKERQS